MKLKFELIFFKRKGLDFSRFMEDEDEQLEKSLQKQQKLTLAKLNVEDTVKDFLESNTKLENKINKSNQEDFSIAFDIKKPNDEKISKFLPIILPNNISIRKRRNFLNCNFNRISKKREN